MQPSGHLGRERDVQNLLRGRDLLAAEGLGGEGRRGRARGQVDVGTHEDIGCAEELAVREMAGEMGDRLGSVELDGRRVDRGHVEARGSQHIDPHQVTMPRVDDPVLVGIDQDGGRDRRAHVGHGGIAQGHRLLGEESLTDADILARTAEGSDVEHGRGGQSCPVTCW